jgi:hypothetical protein
MYLQTAMTRRNIVKGREGAADAGWMTFGRAGITFLLPN